MFDPTVDKAFASLDSIFSEFQTEKAEDPELLKQFDSINLAF